MKFRIAFFATLMIFCAFLAVSAQKSIDYKVTNMKIVPFDQSSGEFESELTDTDSRSFFNELDKGLFVIVEVSGAAGEFDAKKGLTVTVMEGKKIKLKKSMMSGVVNSDGKFYFPVWLEPAMCAEITITATITGNRTASKMTKKIPFMCGE